MRASNPFFVVFIVVLLLAAVFAVLWFSNLLELKTITVQGIQTYGEDEIAATSGLSIGMNLLHQVKPDRALLRLGLSAAEEKLMKLPYVRHATVRMLLPNTVSILIKERIPAAYIAWVGNYLLVDEEGVVLAVSTDKPGDAYKEIRGIQFDQYAIGTLLVVDQPALLDTALLILKAVRESDVNSENDLWPQVDWVDVINTNRVAVSLAGRVAVRLDPADELQYHIDFAKEIFFEHIRSDEHGMLDFTKGGYPSFIPD